MRQSLASGDALVFQRAAHSLKSSSASIGALEFSELAKEFTKEFGTMVCIDLVGIDFSVPEQRRRYFAENITKDTCDRFVAFAVRKLYELEDKRSQS